MLRAPKMGNSMFQFLVSFAVALALVTVRLCAWNEGFDAGVKNKQDDDILRGKVICYYKDSKKRSCNSR